MRQFGCRQCGQPLYFENTHCETCGTVVAFSLQALDLVPLAGGGRACANRELGGCNWLAEAPETALCTACAFNRTIPDLSLPENVARWQRIERAKRRLVYGLDRLGILPPAKAVDPSHGLAFDLIAQPPGAAPVYTGHADGLVTLNIAEADAVERTRRQEQMEEPYRTLLGHFRHEVGHYFWERLVRDAGRLDAFRELFGDERADYGAALDRHYRAGPPPDWNARHISAYAAAHPWEDWAETWAHYLHIADALETAARFGLSTVPVAAPASGLAAAALGDPYRPRNADVLVDAWLPLVFAVNSLNRSMGLGDLYPFVLGEVVRRKLRGVHECIEASRARLS